jgi:hypothetical protein
MLAFSPCQLILQNMRVVKAATGGAGAGVGTVRVVRMRHKHRCSALPTSTHGACEETTTDTGVGTWDNTSGDSGGSQPLEMATTTAEATLGHEQTGGTNVYANSDDGLLETARGGSQRQPRSARCINADDDEAPSLPQPKHFTPAALLRSTGLLARSFGCTHLVCPDAPPARPELPDLGQSATK